MGCLAPIFFAVIPEGHRARLGSGSKSDISLKSGGPSSGKDVDILAETSGKADFGYRRRVKSLKWAKLKEARALDKAISRYFGDQEQIQNLPSGGGTELSSSSNRPNITALCPATSSPPPSPPSPLTSIHPIPQHSLQHHISARGPRLVRHLFQLQLLHRQPLIFSPQIVVHGLCSAGRQHEVHHRPLHALQRSLELPVPERLVPHQNLHFMHVRSGSG